MNSININDMATSEYKKYSYASEQDYITVTNTGTSDLMFDVGKYTNIVLHPSQTWANEVGFKEFQIKSLGSPCIFTAELREYGNDYVTSAQLAENAKQTANAWRNSLLTTTPNPNFRKYTPKFRETFGDRTRWASTTAALTDDTTNYSAAGVDKREDGSWVQTTGKAMKVTKTTTSQRNSVVSCNLTTPMDLTGHHCLFRFYVHEGSGNSSYQYLNCVYVYIYDTAGKSAHFQDPGLNGNYKPGWRTLSFSSLSGQDAGFNIAAVNKIEIVAFNHTGENTQTPSITYDFLEFFPKIATPIPYVVTMDGGYIAQKDALAYLTARGIRSHIYVTYDQIGKAGYMTLEDLRQAQFMGHFIDVHERNAAPVGFNTMTEAQKKQSVEESINWKMENGFLNSHGFAPLGGQGYNDADVLNYMYPYFEHFRLTNPLLNNPWNPRILGVNYDTNNLTVAQEATARAKAISDGTFYVGLVHSLVSSFTLADFKTIIDAAIADANIKFVTIPELISTNWYAAH